MGILTNSKKKNGETKYKKNKKQKRKVVCFERCPPKPSAFEPKDAPGAAVSANAAAVPRGKLPFS